MKKLLKSSMELIKYRAQAWIYLIFLWFCFRVFTFLLHFSLPSYSNKFEDLSRSFVLISHVNLVFMPGLGFFLVYKERENLI